MNGKKLLTLLMAAIFMFAVSAFAADEEGKEDNAFDNAIKERKMTLDEKKHELDVEKWNYEKAEKDEKKLKAKLSVNCNLERGEIPVITIDAISGSTPDYMRKDLSILWELGHKKIYIDIFSGGGSAFGGMGIADTLQYWHEQGMEIIGRAYGLIASAAVPVFASCSVRKAGPSTLFMVHEAAIGKFMTYESTSDIKAQKEMLDTLQHRYCLILERHSNIHADEWARMLKETTWFDTNKALEWELIDKVE